MAVGELGASHAVHAARRLRAEVALLLAQLPVVGGTVAYLAYFGYMLFRNLAFYRFEAGPRLRDLGHELVPPLGAALHELGELPMLALYLLIAALSLATFVAGPMESTVPKPYFVNMFRRFATTLAIGHTLRFASYIGTSLPGAADHCMLGSVEKLTPPRPTSAYEVFTRYAATPGSNCGDLIFSGHMLQAIIFGCIVARYGQRCFALSSTGGAVLRGVTYLLVSSQAFIIVSARNHYTVDVVVASYTTPLLWYFYCNALHPSDLEPEDIALPAFAAAALSSARRRTDRRLGARSKYRNGLSSPSSLDSGGSRSSAGFDAEIDGLLPADWDDDRGEP